MCAVDVNLHFNSKPCISFSQNRLSFDLKAFLLIMYNRTFHHIHTGVYVSQELCLSPEISKVLILFCVASYRLMQLHTQAHLHKTILFSTKIASHNNENYTAYFVHFAEAPPLNAIYNSRFFFLCRPHCNIIFLNIN